MAAAKPILGVLEEGSEVRCLIEDMPGRRSRLVRILALVGTARFWTMTFILSKQK